MRQATTLRTCLYHAAAKAVVLTLLIFGAIWLAGLMTRSPEYNHNMPSDPSFLEQ